MRWSISAHNTFRRCQRQFFFGNIMASHNAKDPLRREAFILKQLKHLPVWRGTLVHECLSDFFVPSIKTDLISKNDLTKITLERVDQQFLFSKNRLYRKGSSKSSCGSHYCALYEHELGLNIDDSRINLLKHEISQCFEYLYGNADFINKLKNCASLTNEINLPFKMDETTIAAKLDLTFIDNTHLNIVDWKIGASDTSDYSKQLFVYALAATHKIGRRIDQIKLFEVNLLKKQIIEHAVDQDKLQNTEDFIYKSISDIRSVTHDQKYENLNVSDFETAKNSKNCEFCNYQSLCVRMSNEK
ncbi:MAG TPA: PD-(D/E)XK nuclease family protein [Methanoregula sp.]|nr:PD-(D/E)XK nuclease family protein [Methanoregula sp.]